MSQPLKQPVRFDTEIANIDQRFRSLVGRDGWRRLPRPIRRRFGSRKPVGQSTFYRGQVLATTLSGSGWILAQAARVLGGPLPTESQAGEPTTVTVTESLCGKAQWWARQFTRRSNYPHVIQSTKRFDGPTGLEERIGWGVGMSLTLHADHDRLVFRSDHFFVQWLGRRFRVPAWLMPITIEVTHLHVSDRDFVFQLKVGSGRLGTMIRQRALYREVEPC